MAYQTSLQAAFIHHLSGKLTQSRLWNLLSDQHDREKIVPGTAFTAQLHWHEEPWKLVLCT